MMTFNRIIGVTHELLYERVDGTVGKRHHPATVRADEVMPVSRLPDDIRRMPARLQQPRQEIDRGEDFQRPVDRRPSNVRKLTDDLLGAERPVMIEHGRHDFPPGRRRPIAMARQDGHRMIEREG